MGGLLYGPRFNGLLTKCPLSSVGHLITSQDAIPCVKSSNPLTVTSVLMPLFLALNDNSRWRDAPPLTFLRSTIVHMLSTVGVGARAGQAREKIYHVCRRNRTDLPEPAETAGTCYPNKDSTQRNFLLGRKNHAKQPNRRRWSTHSRHSCTQLVFMPTTLL